MKKYIITLICALAIAPVIFSTNSYGWASTPLSASITAFNNVTCNGGNTGSATVTATGGTPPYTYLWSPTGGTNMTASNLSVGTYTVTVTDASSSTDTASVIITQPSPLMASINLNSNGGSLTAIVDVSGKAGYSGDGGPATAAEVYAPTSATTDKYRNIYISDWDNHRIREVNDTTGIITTIVGSGIAGSSGDGGPATACRITGPTDAKVDSSGNLWIADYLNSTVRVVTNSTTNPWPNNINGGNPTTPGYIYTFNTAIYSLVQTLFFDATGNLYLLDQGGSGDFLIVTNSTTNPWPTIINGGNPTTPGATYTMAQGGLRYQGLAFDKAGNLYYTSLDYRYIYVITKTTVNPWPALINSGNPTIPGHTYKMYILPNTPHYPFPGPTWLSFDKYQNLYVADYYANQIYVVPWQGDSISGYAYVNTSGDYGYTTNGNATTGYIYWPNSCWIDNENNMYITDQIGSPNSGVQKVAIAYSRNVPCYGYGTASATATGVGGTSPYSYQWSSGQTSNSISGLSAGVYTVTVTDSNGCTATDTISVAQPAQMTITHDSVAQNGPCNGIAAVTVSGATPPYTYLWTTGHQTTDSIIGQCAGTYCCQITDNNGCRNSTCVTVNSLLGVQDISVTASISISPNPNDGYFTISGLADGEVIDLYNYLGKKLNSVIADKPTMQFDISTKANGIYLVRIQNKNNQLVTQKKIIKTQ